ncbi:MAG TPA: tryptophan 7-halogenase [Rhodopila sp.]|uniref:tryptophan 7-halogenase n=1 Tax=Rhodopila sp. TaxID=2480087 RepID=UPI002BEC114A|nr:tryptophan 7-halogenase [Rhodopila sp.]HVY17247.1 tryptophan 7-halogenase [Rhodopila sp.]
MIAADVCVIGGGPAGAAAALTLARYTRHAVLLLEASGYAAFRVGETVSAGIVPLLSYLGAESVLAGAVSVPAYGTAGAWGGEQLIRRDFIWTGRGQGLHLDRNRFDAALAACLSRFGDAPRVGTLVRDLTWRDGRWVVDLDAPEGRTQLEARIVVDATGRPARIARRLNAERAVTDRLVGLVCHLDLPKEQGEQTTLVETVPEGWWYTATLPGGKAVAALMTDADLLRGLGIGAVGDFLTRMSATRHVAARLEGARPLGEPRAFPAESHVLHPPCGPGWIAAGDAACAFDPLASLGIGYALASGIQAARIADEWLRGEDGLARAYAADIARHAGVYSAQAREMYQAERRWPDAPFWRRRLG